MSSAGQSSSNTTVRLELSNLSGAAITATIKSGSNAHHGELFANAAIIHANNVNGALKSYGIVTSSGNTNFR